MNKAYELEPRTRITVRLTPREMKHLKVIRDSYRIAGLCSVFCCVNYHLVSSVLPTIIYILIFALLPQLVFLLGYGSFDNIICKAALKCKAFFHNYIFLALLEKIKCPAPWSR